MPTAAELDFLICNGLTETTPEDQAMFEECMAISVPFTAHWEDLDNEVKILQWDSEFEKYLKQYAALIDYEGRESYLPWNIYDSLRLNWMDGYAVRQRTGDCVSFGAGNSAQTSMLTIAKRTGREPIELAYSVAYAIASGKGRPKFGSGLNLNAMSKWAATVGNYWAADFSKYDGGAYVRKYRKGSEQDTHALQTQSIPVFLPAPEFEYVYAACSAGFGINMGTHTFPTASVVNSAGLGQASGYRGGAHSMCFVAAMTAASGKRYVYLKNSHGARYAADKYSRGKKQFGCWCGEEDLKKMADGFRYGNWYVNLVEMKKG